VSATDADGSVASEGPKLNGLPETEIVMPAHNEGLSIGHTLREFHAACVDNGVPVRFMVTEDGSTDDTCQVVREVARDLPVRLLSFPERKGYSRAVVDGLKETTAGIVGFVDADGQCDPNDLPTLLESLPGHDMVIGYRHPRHDSLFRRMISGAFGTVYRRLFPVSLRDPSCPYLVIRRSGLEKVLEGNPGILPQGFWWEFNARAAAHGLSVVEVPVKHREREAGATQVYRVAKLPRIALEHLRGLFALRNELRSFGRAAPSP
jgi:dolichol-phosphate mannosyltransferase